MIKIVLPSWGGSAAGQSSLSSDEDRNDDFGSSHPLEAQRFGTRRPSRSRENTNADRPLLTSTSDVVARLTPAGKCTATLQAPEIATADSEMIHIQTFSARRVMRRNLAFCLHCTFMCAMQNWHQPIGEDFVNGPKNALGSPGRSPIRSARSHPLAEPT